MTRLLAITVLLFGLVAPAARASEEVDDGAMVPTRVQLAAALRPGTSAGSVLEGGVQVLHKHPTQLDLGVAFTFPHRFSLPGDWRTSASLDMLANLGFEIGPYLVTGPSVGLALRLFGQTGQHLMEVPVPLVGWTAGVAMLRSRRFAIELFLRGQGDLRQVDLVLPTQVVRMARVEGRVGLRFVFGYQGVQ